MKKSWVSALILGILGTAAAPAGAQVLTTQVLTKYTPISVVTTPVTTATVATPVTTATVVTPATTITSVSLIAYPWWIYVLQPTWKCRRWDLSACTNADLGNPNYRQILIMPSGYVEADRAAFWTDFETIITQMANTGSVWSTQKRDRILWVGYYVGGGALGTPQAAFGGAVMAHPIRNFALTLSLEAVKKKVSDIKATDISNLKPMGVLCILNDFRDDITANAAPPSFMNTNYGIAKMNRDDLNSGYISTHELGHAALNFLDEYVEPGMENLNMRSIDVATPLVLFDGTWSGFVRGISDLFGIYDYNMSEILANNGNHNVALSSVPSTVYSPISAPQQFKYEGGFFFGKGTFHGAGKNLMNSNSYNPQADNGFDWKMSGSQQMLVNTAFGDAPYRANDRLRNAGPKDGWWGELGGTTTVMMFDGDKRNQFHKTQQYAVQLGYYNRVWWTEWLYGFIPVPHYRDDWTTVQKAVYPTNRKIDLRASSLYGLANLAQGVLCGVGVTEIPKPDGTMFNLCANPLSTIASAFLPTFEFSVPYEEAQVPADQWFTTYWWRFASHNGSVWSGWTGWSSFYRSL